MFRRNRSQTPFHLTDLENLYGNLRDGNHATALRYAVRVLDRGLNGPADGLPKAFTATHSYGEAEKTKAHEIADKLEQMVGGAAGTMEHTSAAGKTSPFDDGPKTHAMPAAGRTTKEKQTEAKETGKSEAGKGTSASAAKVAAGVTPVHGGTGTAGKEGGKQEIPDEFSKPDHRKPGDDDAPGGDQSPGAAGALNIDVLSDDHRNAAIPWEAISQIVMLVIAMIRGWQNV